jgi:acyl carrier protein
MVELNKVIEIVEAAGVVPDMSKFDPNKTFRENDVDSLDVLNLFLAVEEQLGVKFSDEEASQINSVAMMVETINSH